MSNYLDKQCNHDVDDEKNTLNPIIKTPRASLSPKERVKEDLKPDTKCTVCGKEMLSYPPPYATCVRKTK